MELDDFKSAYLEAGKQDVSKQNIKQMMNALNPTLKGIRKQLILETILWVIFLVVYYDFFDGHLKPLIWNVLLVLSVLLVLVHNILGYRIAENPINGPNIRQSFEQYLTRIRKYSMLSIASRALAITILFAYFLSTVESPGKKYGSIGFLLLIIFIQVYFLNKVWASRINHVKSICQELS